MTVFAFERFYFINNVSTAVPGRRFVASGAGHLYVFAVERETGFCMVELRGRPETAGYMASAAVGCPFVTELSFMVICMAGTALGRKTLELLKGCSGVVFSVVAGPAVNACVFALHLKGRAAVIEIHQAPPLFDMAKGTAVVVGKV